MSGEHWSPLFRGRLNGKDQVPPEWKWNQDFYFSRQHPDSTSDHIYYKPHEMAPAAEFRGKQRQLTEDLVDLKGVEHQDTVEGDDILQVLLSSSRQRAGIQGHVEPVMVEDDQISGHILERNEDTVAPARWNRDKYQENDREAEYQDGVADESISEQDSPSNSLTMAQWVDTLLVGISIVLTWPIGLAYFRG